LPVLYACVNNQYAISTYVGNSHVSANIVDIARGYQLPCVQVDGNDIESAYEATREAVAYIRAGQGPYFVEYKTYRWQGVFHGEFRPPEEVRHWKEDRDPIKLARQKLLDGDRVQPADLDHIEAGVKAQIEHWIDFALKSPMPDPAKATSDVYAEWQVELR
jgi:pyruvate dehydrogenase E1 component alpha subunit